jgi:hypothetical protein
MKTIWKFPVPVENAGDRVTMKMPKGADILTIQVQQNTICLSAIVDPAKEVVDFEILLVGTGHALPMIADKYIGTIQLDGGALVLHAFAVEYPF